MPWFNEIDDTRPTDLEFVSEGAHRFRELKRALIERFGTAFADFPDEYSERAGEALLFSIAGSMVGTQAQRPTNPSREGHLWFSYDTGRFFVGNHNGQWQEIGSGSGSGGAGGAGNFVAKTYFASAFGDPSVGPDVAAAEVLYLNGNLPQTNAQGLTTLNFNFVGRDLADAILMPNTIVFWPSELGGIYSNVFVEDIDVPNNILTLRVRWGDGPLVVNSSTTIPFRMQIAFAAPTPEPEPDYEYEV